MLGIPDWPGEQFDFILDGFCLHCIIGEDRPVFLANAFRLLKPGWGRRSKPTW